MSDARYPIGTWQRRDALTADERRTLIDHIAACPSALRDAVANLDEAQLDTPYRDGGWTVRQVAHHLADSHMNGYVRFKLGLTEEKPTVKPYDENAWSLLADAHAPIASSLALLDALHERWITLLRATPDADFARSVYHPENGDMTLDTIVSNYAWHARHHVAQITSLRQRRGGNEKRGTGNESLARQPPIPRSPFLVPRSPSFALRHATASAG